jgi:hypothetical protein
MIIFTCTTYFDFSGADKFALFVRAIKSLLQHHPESVLKQIDKWVVVNEYGGDDGDPEWGSKVSKLFPFMTVVQKHANQKGQAASMNLILELIKPYDLWIHWEESWYAGEPFLQDALDVMAATNVTQLQFTRLNGKVSWSDVGDRFVCKDGQKHCDVLPPSNVPKIMTVASWPLYSLLPSINRVSGYKDLPPFSTKSSDWPFVFEYKFGKRWLEKGNTKAVLQSGPVIRDTNHVSTYSILNAGVKTKKEIKTATVAGVNVSYMAGRTTLTRGDVMAIIVGVSAIIIVVLMVIIYFCTKRKRVG